MKYIKTFASKVINDTNSLKSWILLLVSTTFMTNQEHIKLFLGIHSNKKLLANL